MSDMPSHVLDLLIPYYESFFRENIENELNDSQSRFISSKVAREGMVNMRTICDGTLR